MPTITIRDLAAGLPHELSTLPKRLKDLGLPVPEALAEGLKKAYWKVPLPDLTDAAAAIRDAKTEAEYQAAVVKYAEGLVVRSAMGSSDEIQTATRSFAYEAAAKGLRACYLDIIATLQAEFVKAGAEFAEIVRDVPEDTPTDVYSIDPDIAAVLPKARQLAKRMTEILGVLNNVHLITYGQGKHINTSPADNNAASKTVNAIAVFEDDSAAVIAARDIASYKHGGKRGVYTELVPYAPIVRLGGTFVAPDQFDDVVKFDDSDDDPHYTLID